MYASRKSEQRFQGRPVEVVGDISVFWNSSEQTVKELQESGCSEDGIVAEYRRLSNMLIAHAEPFIKDLEEVENGTLAFHTVKPTRRGYSVRK